VGAAPVESTFPIRVDQVVAHPQPLHQQCLLLLEETRALLEVFTGLMEPDEGDSPLDKLIEDFNHDRDYTESVIAAGAKVGKAEIDNMLADKNNEVRGTKKRWASWCSVLRLATKMLLFLIPRGGEMSRTKRAALQERWRPSRRDSRK
jgi:hypothetical protein